MNKKLFSIVTACLTLLSALSGCKSGVPETTSSDTETGPAQTAPAAEEFFIIKDGEQLLTLLRSEEAGEYVKTAFSEMSSALSSGFGIFCRGDTDWTRGKPDKGTVANDSPEILLGETNRVESRDAFLDLGPGEYTIRVSGSKLVIAGYTDWLTLLGVRRFNELYVPAAGGSDLAVPGDLSITENAYASHPSDSVAGPVFETVIPQGEPIKLKTEKWLACEILLQSDRDYGDPVYTVDTDAVFRNRSTGRTMKIPAFWDGGRNWKIRFALPETGEWEFYTVCSEASDAGLHHRTGTVGCSEYTGALDIYRHGFVKTEYGKNYFMYDDGTPFFYLADTHWTLALEEIDGYGSVETEKTAGITKEKAEQYGITSQFRYIMDYRASQGYTVIQSQPLGWWTNPGQNGWFADDLQNIFTYGVNGIMLEKFRQYDRYFEYIAALGLVHANSQFGYPTALMSEYFADKITDVQLEKLCRYWVARYSAYPVMWVTTQEGDNDYYGEDRGDCAATPETNPWLSVIDYLAKYDPYRHPATCHQENAVYTRVKNSAFGPKESHTWYAAQYTTQVSGGTNWDWAKEYYGNPGSKPVVNYEGRYDHFWVGTFGSRAQGWLAYMNGQVGYGYGVQPIWSIFWSGNGITDFTGSDETGQFRMDADWVDGLYAEAGEQVTYIKDLLTRFEWWELVPCFNSSYFYAPAGNQYAVCSIRNSLYIGYFYGNSTGASGQGRLTGMEDAEYEMTWFNCRTGEYSESFKVNVTGGSYQIPQKPDSADWVFVAKLAGS